MVARPLQNRPIKIVAQIRRGQSLQINRLARRVLVESRPRVVQVHALNDLHGFIKQIEFQIICAAGQSVVTFERKSFPPPLLNHVFNLNVVVHANRRHHQRVQVERSVFANLVARRLMIEPVISARRRLHPHINFRRNFFYNFAVVFVCKSRARRKNYGRRQNPREKFFQFHFVHPFREDYIEFILALQRRPNPRSLCIVRAHRF